MSASFTERMKSSKVLKDELDNLQLTKLPDMTKFVKLMWAEKFGLPPNDERLLSLTLREAAEQVFGQDALLKYLRDREPPQHKPYDEHAPPEAETRTDDAARAITLSNRRSAPPALIASIPTST